MTVRTVLLGFAALTAASVPASAETLVQLIPHYSPVRAPSGPDSFFYISPSFPAYEANVIAGLRAGGVPFGPANSPTRFEPLDKTVFSIEETFGTPFNSWLGDVTPTGAYAGEYGTFIRSAVRVVSDTPFTLADVAVEFVFDSFDQDTGDPIVDSFSYTLADFFIFAPDVVGLALDGSTLDSDLADPAAQLTALFFVGDGFINGLIPPDDFAALGIGKTELFPFLNNTFGEPFDFSLTYTLAPAGRVLASDTFAGQVIAQPVPEPATWATMIAGFALIGAATRRRRDVVTA